MPKNSHFEKFYKKFSTPLSHFIAKRIGAEEKVTEEILEETFVAAWKGLKTFRHKSSYFTWLCRIALNKIADYYRDQVNTRSRIITPSLKTLANLEDDSVSPEERMALDQLRKRVNGCLDLLPAKKRRYLQFRYWYDLSYSQIAKLTGTSERAVEGQIYRAKEEFVKVWSSKSE